ncbi:MAG: ribbon-helix-helix domain-containing protein [Dehalococcoidia bacterium]
MEQRNVTVSLPAELLREVRHMAVDRGVSLSRFIALLLEQQVEERQQYEAAKDRQVSLLRIGLPLGTQGRVGWSRGDLHER